MKQYRQHVMSFIDIEWCHFSDYESKFARCLLEDSFDLWFPTEWFYSTSKEHDGRFTIKKMKIVE